MTCRFVILTRPRTGSTALWRTLDLHPGIRAFGEVLLAGKVVHPQSYHAFHARSELSDQSPIDAAEHLVEDYLDRLMTVAPHVKAVGFKLMLQQLWPAVHRWLERERPKVVHLIRRNLLKALVSLKAAEQRRMFHRQPGERAPNVRVRLDVDALLPKLEKFHERVEQCRALADAHTSIEIAYEDLVEHREQTYSRVFEFLGVEPIVDLETPLRKINSDDLSDVIENWSEVQSTLRDTRFESFLGP